MRRGTVAASRARALERDLAAHALDDAARDREPETGAAELARGAAVRLFELLEDAQLCRRGDADAGVANQEADFIGPVARLGRERDAAGRRELDRIAGEIEQHLAQ